MLLVGRMGRLGAAYNEDMTHDPKEFRIQKHELLYLNAHLTSIIFLPI